MLNTTEYASAKPRLLAASSAYYTDGTSELTDPEYDALEADVIEFETAHPDLIDGDPVAEAVAGGANIGGTVAHTVPMLSLEKITDDVPALVKWLTTAGLTNNDLVVVEPKLDGSSMAIRYENGVPVQMLTRGDGQTGEDRTAALADITNLPNPAGTFTGEVRGEVLFTREQFAQANTIREAHDKTPFANARNGAAGALSGAASRDYRIPLSFFVYDVVGDDLADTHSANLTAMADLGFALAADQYDSVGLRQAVEALSLKANRDALDVEIDGLVIKANRASDRKRLGLRSKSPRWAVAYKFATVLDDLPTTTLEDVEWAVGRTGVIAPRARIAPVSVGGTTVTYATLHNPDDIARRGFMLGDTVYVRRAGEVIPRLEGVKTEARDGSQRPIDLPTTCPNCGSDIDRSQARWVCVRGTECRTLAGLEYAVSRDALDVEGLSGSVLGAMLDEGIISNLADLFGLSIGDIAAVPTSRRKNDGTPVYVGETTARKIAANIDGAKTAGLGRVVTALGIPLTGRRASRKIALHFGSMDALLNASKDDLLAIEGFGERRAQSVSDALDSLRPMIERLEACGVHMVEDETVPAADVLAGKSVCITGALTKLTRSEMQSYVESLGGKASSSVSKNTDMLIAGEKAGSKLAKAKSLGVRILSEDEFMAEFSA